MCIFVVDEVFGRSSYLFGGISDAFDIDCIERLR